VVAIKAGQLLASAVFDAMKLACLGVEATLCPLGGERVPTEILLPIEAVDRANCAAWNLPYAQRPPNWSERVRGWAALAAPPELDIVALHNFPLRCTTRLGTLWAAFETWKGVPRK
jgi:hypothetical protein